MRGSSVIAYQHCSIISFSRVLNNSNICTNQTFGLKQSADYTLMEKSGLTCPIPCKVLKLSLSGRYSHVSNRRKLFMHCRLQSTTIRRGRNIHFVLYAPYHQIKFVEKGINEILSYRARAGERVKYSVSAIDFQPWVKKSKEMLSYTSLSLMAEIGGYVGIFLGYSLLNLADSIYQFLKIKSS